MDKCTDCCDITYIILRKALNTIQAISQCKKVRLIRQHGFYMEQLSSLLT